jgi:hypothetical protein
LKIDISRFFGKGAAFADACEIYRQRYKIPFPADVLEEADQIEENARRAFLLGYAFKLSLAKRAAQISPEELKRLSEAKINQSDPRNFVRGFRICELRNAGFKTT